MWLSKKLVKSSTSLHSDSPEIGNLSISTNDLMAAISSCEKRGITFYTPLGIEFYPSEGQKVLLVSCGNHTACAGVEMKKSSTLKAGEIRLFSEGGANVLLKNDGSITLNDSVTIDKNGDIFTSGRIIADSFEPEA